MPDTIRATSGGGAHPRQCGFLAAVGAVTAWPLPAQADEETLFSLH